MPLYEYECKQCHQRLEKIQSFSAPPEKVCPACGGELARVISAPAIQFKGAGWYVNDYAKSGSKSAPAGGTDGKSESKPENQSGDKSDSGSENKPSAGGDGAGSTKTTGDAAAAPAASSPASTGGSSSASSTKSD